jgi:hypothetical protein
VSICLKSMLPAAIWVPPNQKERLEMAIRMNWLLPKPRPATSAVRPGAAARSCWWYRRATVGCMLKAATVLMAPRASAATASA